MTDRTMTDTELDRAMRELAADYPELCHGTLDDAALARMAADYELASGTLAYPDRPRRSD